MKKLMLMIILGFVFCVFSQEQNALSFDGTNDCVNISAAVTSATATQPITVEAWIYPTTDSDTRLIASKYYGSDVSKCNFLLTRNSSQKIYIAANGSNVITSNGAVPLNAWTHIAVVFQSGTNNTKIYINGVLDISGSLTYNTVNSSTVMQIGQFTNITSFPVYQEWSGIIDEFSLWNTVRTQAQIYENMNAPLTGSETGLVAYYGFNQGTANGINTGLTTVTDLTGHGWNGALVGFALTGSISNWVGGVVFSPPAPPAALEATIVSSTSFTANWSSSQGATGYELDLATDSLFTGFVQGYENKDIGNVTSHNVVGLTQGIKYFYRVRAYNPIGTSVNSNVVSVTIKTPDAPTALSASNISYTVFRANWNSIKEAAGYYLDVATDSVFLSYVPGYENKNVSNVTFFNLTGLASDTEYYYRVRAYNGCGNSGNSNIAALRTLKYLTPDAPVALAATNISYTEFRANWNPIADIEGYYLDVATDELFTDLVTGFNGKDVGNVLTVTVIPLMMDTDYYYRVRAYNPAGTSSNSNVITAKTLYSVDPVAVAPYAGDGTIGNPYQIASLNNLYWVAANTANWTKHYIQTADIDASVTKYWFSGQGWSPIGDTSIRFSGSYKGDQHIIERLYINRPAEWAIGLFGNTAGASITGLGLSYCDFTGLKYVGGIVGTGSNGGSLVTNISNCFTTGDIISKDASWSLVGGIVGDGYYTSISSCYSYCNVYGIKYAGGLVGDISGTSINKSYSTGNVNPPVNISYWNGGLCGGSGGTIASSFWDTETSGYTTSHGGIGKTTVQMMTQSTFTSAGWDFVDTWEISDGYPKFKWQDHTPAFVTTFGASDITTGTINVSGSVYSIGELPLIEHGVCWNTTGNPTVNDFKTDEGSMGAEGEFMTQMTGLYPGTAYYARAYVSNGKAVVYGKQIAVSTSQIAFEQPAGDGSEINPYQISSLENLYWMSSGDNEVSTPPRSVRWASHYVQTADIDASATGTWFSGQGWLPVGDASIQFTGKYNGQDHNITGLSIVRIIEGYDLIEYIGLFGYIVNSEIRNVNLINTNIKGGKYVGSIAGFGTSSLIDSCSSEGSIQGSYIGGIAGYSYNSTISNSSSSSEILCWVRDYWEGYYSHDAGGIAGYNYNSDIIRCFSRSSVTGSYDIGGIVGFNRSGSLITSSYNTGSVSGVSEYNFRIGGIAGYSIEGSEIQNSYNTGCVQGVESIGGVAGLIEGNIVSNCYSIGEVISSISSKGGLIAEKDEASVVEDCFWDVTTSNTSWSAGGTGLTTQEMKDKAIMITAAGWDYAGESANGTEDIWNTHPFFNNGYPFLTYQDGVPPGDGSSGNPYQVASFVNLQAISESYSSWVYSYIQTTDIDASATLSLNAGAGWSPIGNYNNAFTGSYNGQDHSINSLFINRGTGIYVGLFGRISGSKISNLSLSCINITGKDHVGGLAGYNYNFSTIENCSVTGSVTGSTNTGGLSGSNWYSSVISRSSSDCSVTGNSNTGGLVGYSYNASSIDNCYSRSNVTSASYYGGGLIGQNITSSVTNSYSTGTVSGLLANIGGFIGYNNSTVSNCFWDTETSGLTKTSGGTGKTTAEMKAIATFTNAGWDFTGETSNGTNDYWNNGTDNDGYPYLSWQIFVFEAPQNVNGTMTGADFILNWNEVSGASSYSVYSTEDPYAAFPTGWDLENSGIAGSSWTDFSVTAGKKFYVVVAVTAKAENVNQNVKVKK